MIAAVMYSALGFLAATLLALLILPAVWRRAVRLTTRRIEGAIPVSMAEIQADKDQLRAEFAVAARKLERDSDLLRERTMVQAAQISRQDQQLVQWRGEAESASARLAEYESANAELAAANHRHVETLAANERTLEELSFERDALRVALDTARQQLGESTSLSDGLRVEQVALTTTTDSLRGEIADLRRDLAATRTRLDEEQEALRQSAEALAEERSRAEDLRARLGDREAERDAGHAEIASLTTGIAALQARIAELSGRAEGSEAALEDVRAEMSRTTAEADAARLQAEGTARQLGDSLEMIRAEKTMLEDALSHAREERVRLTDALASQGPDQADEAAGDAALRERIGDIAAEVVRLTAALEGPTSPIEAILANANGAGTAPGAPPSLAERIRAIQNRAR